MGVASAGVLAGATGDTPQRPRSARNARTVEAFSPACKLLPMGLTVYYNLGLTESGPEEARAFLRALREAALGLGFVYVEPLREVEPPEGVFGRGFDSVTEPGEARWFLRSAGIMQPHPVGDVKSERVVSVPAVGHALEFCVRDEGTETAVLGLARLAGHVGEDCRGEPVDHQTGLGGKRSSPCQHRRRLQSRGGGLSRLDQMVEQGLAAAPQRRSNAEHPLPPAPSTLAAGPLRHRPVHHHLP